MSIRGKWIKNVAHETAVTFNRISEKLFSASRVGAWWEYSCINGSEYLRFTTPLDVFTLRDEISWHKVPQTSSRVRASYQVVTPWKRFVCDNETQLEDIIKADMNRIEKKWAELPGAPRRPIKNLSHAQCLKLGREQL